MSDGLPSNPLDALKQFRESASREAQEQVALIKQMSPEDRAELITWLCINTSMGLDQLYSGLSGNCQCEDCADDTGAWTMTQ